MAGSGKAIIDYYASRLIFSKKTNTIALAGDE